MKRVNWHLELCFALLTMFLFLATLFLNAWLFKRLEFVPGITWIFLPAGIRLLCTLLFAHSGAVGLLLASWLVGFLHYFPEDAERALVGGIISGGAPYLVYLAARRFWGLHSSLANLSTSRLLSLAIAYAFCNAFLHLLYFAWREQPELLQGLLATWAARCSCCTCSRAAWPWCPAGPDLHRELLEGLAFAQCPDYPVGLAAAPARPGFAVGPAVFDGPDLIAGICPSAGSLVEPEVTGRDAVGLHLGLDVGDGMLDFLLPQLLGFCHELFRLCLQFEVGRHKSSD
jgi:hypothetical protein